jgi:hypothetical protein
MIEKCSRGKWLLTSDVDPTKSNKWDKFIIVDENQDIVAVTPKISKSVEEITGNAHLIVGALDLYNAVNSAMWYMKNTVLPEDRGRYYQNVYNELKKSMEKAEKGV